MLSHARQFPAPPQPAMNFDSGTSYAESDADDEYERSVHASSPVIATDSEISPTDSEGLSSTEHTPTTYGHRSSADRLPETVISEWTAEEVADFIATIGLEQYSDIFVGTCMMRVNAGADAHMLTLMRARK